MEELEAYDADVHACGHHKSVIDDPDSIFQPERDMCRLCAGVAVYQRMLEAEDEAARKKRNEKTPPGAPLPSDGRSFHMRLLVGAEAEAARKKLRDDAALQQRGQQQEPGEARDD